MNQNGSISPPKSGSSIPRYQAKRDRLAALQQAVDTAARNLQTNKRALETERRRRAAEEIAGDAEGRPGNPGASGHRCPRETRSRQAALDEETQQLEDKRSDQNERERSLASREEQYRADLTPRSAARHSGAARTPARSSPGRVRTAQPRAPASSSRDRRAGEATRCRARSAARASRTIVQDQSGIGRATTAGRSSAPDDRRAAIDARGSAGASSGRAMKCARKQGCWSSSAPGMKPPNARFEERQQQLAAKLSTIDTEHTSHTEARRQFDERSAAMNAAVAQMRQLQDRLTTEAETQRIRAADLDRQSAELAEQTEQVKQRAAQLVALQEQLSAERARLCTARRHDWPIRRNAHGSAGTVIAAVGRTGRAGEGNRGRVASSRGHSGRVQTLP